MNGHLRGWTRRSTLCVVAMLLPLTSSCVTAALWGGSIEDGERDGTFRFDFQQRARGPTDIAVKSLLSPLTVVVDVCTSPVQAIYYGGDVSPLVESLLEDGAAHCLFD